MSVKTVRRTVAVVVVIALGAFVTLRVWFYGVWGLTKSDIASSSGSKGLHLYGLGDVQQFLIEIGHSEYFPPTRVLRASNGSALRFVSRGKGLEATCAGRLREFDVPSDNVWLDDNGSVVATHADGQYVEFTNGRRLKQSMNPLMADASGRFFIKHSSGQNPRQHFRGRLEIRSTESHGGLLATLAHDDPNARLFIKGEELWLVSNDPSPSKISTIYRYEILQGRLEPMEDVKIEKPSRGLFVRDVNPVRGDLLFIERYDPPLDWLSRWHVFDFEKRELLRAGPASHYGFYLTCDILAMTNQSGS